MMASAMQTSASITGIVRAPDGVRFAVSGQSLDEVMSAVAEYVRERFRDVLWPRDARHVGELIARRDAYAAVAAYFALVGSRWDEELLDVRFAPASGAATAGLAMAGASPDAEREPAGSRTGNARIA